MRTYRLLCNISLAAILTSVIAGCGSSGGGQSMGGATRSTGGPGDVAASRGTSSGTGSSGGVPMTSSSAGGTRGGGEPGTEPADHGGKASTSLWSNTGGKGGTGDSARTGGASSDRSTNGGAMGGAASSGKTSSTGTGGSGALDSRADAGSPGDALPPDTSAFSPADASDAGSTAVCPAGLSAPSAGNRKASLQHGGRSRSYILHVPSGLSAGKPLAVVFDLHGAGGSGSGQQGQSGWASTADREKFLMIYPDGIDGTWNVDDVCCGTAGKQKIDDVGFLKAIIAQSSKDLCIDAKRIYVTGFSNGGGLTHRMGCDAADVIAAIAPLSTDLRTQPCKPARPISMLEVRGMADSLEPYEGGLVGPAGGQYTAVGAKASLKLWADINQCTGATTTMDKYCESISSCKDGVETNLCSLPGVDHSPYQNSLNFNVPDIVWKMFQRQAMK